MSQLFYLPEIYNGATILDEEETRHCTRVLRLREGDPFLITDGRGSLYHCELIDVSSKRARFIISSKEEHYREREIKLHIAIAPTKNTDRFEWFLEKATEIGVDEITPLLCQHSERTKLKTERLEKVIISAMKQSLKAQLPKLNPASEFRLLINRGFHGKKLIGYCDLPETVTVESVLHHGEDALILIGPEGDFSKEEIEEARIEGFVPITFGKSRLRTETAGVVACTIHNFINQ